MMILKNVPNPNYTGQRNVAPTVQVASCSCGGEVVKHSFATYGDPDNRTLIYACIVCGDCVRIEK